MNFELCLEFLNLEGKMLCLFFVWSLIWCLVSYWPIILIWSVWLQYIEAHLFCEQNWMLQDIMKEREEKVRNTEWMKKEIRTLLCMFKYLMFLAGKLRRGNGIQSFFVVTVKYNFFSFFLSFFLFFALLCFLLYFSPLEECECCFDF